MYIRINLQNLKCTYPQTPFLKERCLKAKTSIPPIGRVGRCAVGVVVFGVGRVARGTRGGVWELHGQRKGDCKRIKTLNNIKLPARAAFFAYFLWPFKESRSPKAPLLRFYVTDAPFFYLLARSLVRKYPQKGEFSTF